MATVQIRNLDDAAYGVLRRRAAASGRSLQEYLRLLLEDQAHREPMSEVLGRVRADLVWSEDAVSLAEIADLQRAGRER